VLVCGFDIAHHAMWRDEMQPWLFARDSSSILDLFKNMRYETHPRLWYMILWVVSRVWTNPGAMQVTHLLVIASAVALFVRYCPLPFHLKIPTVFGYYFVYEWGAMSRNYALGVLFCFAACVLFPKRDKGYWPLAVTLFLATQANHFAALLAMAIGGILILEAIIDPEVRARIGARKLEIALCLFLVYGGALLAFWIGIPQPDAGASNFDLSISSGAKILHAFAALWDGFVPLPEPTLLGSWGWGMIGHTLLGPAWHHALLGMLLFPLTVAFFWRSRFMIFAYLGGACMLLALAFVKYDDFARHNGHFYIWFLICIWLAYYFPAPGSPRNPRPFALNLSQKLLFSSLMVVLLFDSAFLSIAGYLYPFSCSKDVADYIDQHNLKQLPIFGYPDYEAMPVAGYAGVKIYYPDTHRWGSFIIENNKRQVHWTEGQVVTAINEFAAQGHPDFLVLLDAPILIEKDYHVFELQQWGNFQKLRSFYPCMQGDEIYWLYRYTVHPPG
jgi:hypothetical protein